MFHTSSQKKHWLFKNEQDLEKLRVATNSAYCEKHAKAAAEKGVQMLSTEEEQLFCQYFLKKLLEFCNVFEPRVPRSAVAIAAAYFKRFYLHTSVMEHNPRQIFFCCVYLAFKIDEYVVSMDQFGNVIAPDLRQEVVEYVLSHELLLLKRLRFHLTVHTPFRPMEGFLIDIKTRTPDIPNPDQLRPAAETFLERSLASDVVLFYPPSQIALSALRHSCRHTKISIDGYILSVLFKTEASEKSDYIMECLEKIEDIVLSAALPDGESVRYIEKKLLKCQVQELSPKSRKRKSGEISGESAEKKIKVEDPMEAPLPGISKLT